MPKREGFLILDACVLIDYVDADASVLEQPAIRTMFVLPFRPSEPVRHVRRCGLPVLTSKLKLRHNR